jgi:hypothetical protein
MNRNGSRPAIRMLPSGMAAILPYHLESEFGGYLMQSLALAGIDRPKHI